MKFLIVERRNDTHEYKDQIVWTGKTEPSPETIERVINDIVTERANDEYETLSNYLDNWETGPFMVCQVLSSHEVTAIPAKASISTVKA